MVAHFVKTTTSIQRYRILAQECLRQFVRFRNNSSDNFVLPHIIVMISHLPAYSTGVTISSFPVILPVSREQSTTLSTINKSPIHHHSNDGNQKSRLCSSCCFNIRDVLFWSNHWVRNRNPWLPDACFMAGFGRKFRDERSYKLGYAHVDTLASEPCDDSWGASWKRANWQPSRDGFHWCD